MTGEGKFEQAAARAPREVDREPETSRTSKNICASFFTFFSRDGRASADVRKT